MLQSPLMKTKVLYRNIDGKFYRQVLRPRLSKAIVKGTKLHKRLDEQLLKARHSLRNLQHKENAKVEGILLRKRKAIHKYRNRHLFRAHRLLSQSVKPQQ